MSDERVRNLAVLNSHPKILEKLGLIKTCKKIGQQTELTNRRERLFGNFIQSDLESSSAKIENFSHLSWGLLICLTISIRPRMNILVAVVQLGT